ncbi:MAG: hypothetical protein K8S97_01160 [Anaerolineae bacterium]|nr:hypothetical protein [Anaerolineae bacterium]
MSHTQSHAQSHTRTAAHPDALAQAAQFTTVDLATNRKGRITRRQMRVLLNDHRRQYYPTLLAWSILGALVGTLALISQGFVLEWGVACLGVTALGALTAYELRHKLHGILHTPPRVVHTTFHVDERWQPRRHLSMIEFKIGARWFTAPRDLVTVLQNGQRYRLYYVEDMISFPSIAGPRLKSGGPRSVAGSYRVLSIEPVGTATEDR